MSARQATTVLLLVVASLSFSGCLRSEEEVRLEADGSGTIRQTWRLDPAARQRLLSAIVSAFGGEDARGPATPPHPVAPSWLRRLARGVRGYEILSATEQTSDDEIVVEHHARFADLKAAGRAGSFFAASIELRRVDANAWELTVRDAWGTAATRPDGELAGRPFRELVELLRPGLDGLSFERTFVFPTRVLETSGELQADGRTVRWRLDLSDIEAGRDLVLTVRFAHSEGLALQSLRHRVDEKTLVLRLTSPPPAGR